MTTQYYEAGIHYSRDRSDVFIKEVKYRWTEKVSGQSGVSSVFLMPSQKIAPLLEYWNRKLNKQDVHADREWHYEEL